MSLTDIAFVPQPTVAAIMIGRAGSTGFPGKNTSLVLGRPLCEYPLMAAKESRYVEDIYVSTDCPKISKVALNYNSKIIERPQYLASNSALGEDAFVHAYQQIKSDLHSQDKTLELVVLLFANAATVNAQLIDQGIDLLRNDQSFDSAVTTSVYNMWSPLRARKKSEDGSLKPFVPFSVFGDPKELNCDRDSQGDVYFADMSVSVVRPKCLDNLKEGLLPQKWMGQKIAPIPSWGGCDVDYPWQIPMVEYWLNNH